MKKISEQKTSRFGHRLVMGLFGVAACIAAIGQPAAAEDAAPKPQAAPAPGQAGMIVNVDPQTGQILPAPAPGTPAPQMTPADQNRMSTSFQGLVERPAPGGGFMVDLQGRFQSPLMATIGPDGKVTVFHAGDQPVESGHDQKR